MVGDNISDNNKEKRRKNEEKAKMYREMMKKEENEIKQLLRNKLIEEKNHSASHNTLRNSTNLTTLPCIPCGKPCIPPTCITSGLTGCLSGENRLITSAWDVPKLQPSPEQHWTFPPVP